eukprot:1162062-Pelagomonas_calceolata.AAC.13
MTVVLSCWILEQAYCQVGGPAQESGWWTKAWTGACCVHLEGDSGMRWLRQCRHRSLLVSMIPTCPALTPGRETLRHALAATVPPPQPVLQQLLPPAPPALGLVGMQALAARTPCPSAWRG